jgi:SAM-dependent methyltransferase
METNACEATNWFEQGGEAYARFRPRYPEELAACLAARSPARRLAVDVGCGTGQLTTVLASHFGDVLGVDSSEDQLAHAALHERVRYAWASSSSLPVGSGTVDLVTVAQAAHWFDLPAFYAEVRRIAAPGALVALVTYGVPRLPAELDARFQRFYAEEIGPFWPAERRLVDRGYVDLPFPFEELEVPAFEMHVAWPLPSWLGYVATWSAVRRAREAGQEDVLRAFAEAMRDGWGASDEPRAVTWPIRMRVGRVDR